MDPQFAHILARLLDAGLAETHIDAEGIQIIRLTPDGERVSRQLGMLDAAGQEALLAGLLEDAEP